RLAAIHRTRNVKVERNPSLHRADGVGHRLFVAQRRGRVAGFQQIDHDVAGDRAFVEPGADPLRWRELDAARGVEADLDLAAEPPYADRLYVVGVLLGGGGPLPAGLERDRDI